MPRVNDLFRLAGTCILAGLMIAVVPAHAQVQYEPGYFIDSAGTKTECLIRDAGWFNNPTEFKYKMNGSEEMHSADIKTVQEFGVAGSTYFRVDVRIDTSSQDLKRLSSDYHVYWSLKTLFLSLVVDGRAKLLRYRTPGLELFFYSVDGSRIEQLVYKRYMVNATNLSSNTSYWDQIADLMICDANFRSKIRSAKYSVGDLTKLFREFNLCYQKASVVDEQDTRTNGFIYTPSISDPPTTFEFKTTLNAKSQTMSAHEIKEFSIGDMRYVRVGGATDQFPSIRAVLKNPGPIFLRLLVEGPSTLYSYKLRDGESFFYTLDGSPIEFLDPTQQESGSSVFLKQLDERLRCDWAPDAKRKRPKYNESSLRDYFLRYNSCREGTVFSAAKAPPAKMRMALATGYDQGTISRVSDGGLFDSSKKPDPGYRLGLTFEFPLGFEKGKWSLFLDPTFQASFKDQPDELYHRSVEVPIGGRHYFFINKNTAVFVNAMLVVDLFMNYRIGKTATYRFSGQGWDKERVNGCGSVGVGFRKKRWYFECRHYLNRRIVSGPRTYLVDFTKTSAIIGYRLSR